MNLQEMMKQAQALQSKMEALKEEAAQQTAEGSAGGGMVNVTVNGKGEVLAVRIEPQVVDPEESEMLQDLVVAATNQAIARAQEAMQEALTKATNGMVPPGLF